jgi:predicted dienelactone hydrolase
MIRLIMSCVACLAVTSCATTNSLEPKESYHVGLTSRQIVPPMTRHWRGATDQRLATRIWYPVGVEVPVASRDIGPPGQSLFVTYPTASGARFATTKKTYPLIVMSHGTGGNADNMDWIAGPLAAAGYIVMAVDHPGNHAAAPMTWDGMTLWWERATDISNVLDGMLSDPELGQHIDATRIGALGFSLGGYTVLELAGAQTDVAAFLAFCAAHRGDPVCEPPEMARLSDQRVSPEARSQDSKASLMRSGASYRDPRIKAVFAIAPALGQSLTIGSMREISAKVGLLTGDKDRNVPPETNFDRIAAAIPAAQTSRIAGAGHYTFIPVCTPLMTARMPTICADPQGTDRSSVHTQANDVIIKFFNEALHR